MVAFGMTRSADFYKPQPLVEKRDILNGLISYSIFILDVEMVHQ